MAHFRKLVATGQRGSGLMIAISALGVFGVLYLVVSRHSENALVEYTTNRRQAEWANFYFRLRAAASSPMNLAQSIDNPGAFGPENSNLIACGRWEATDCPGVATSTTFNNGNLNAKSFHLINSFGQRVAGTNNNPKWYTLNGKPCRDGIAGPATDTIAGVPHDCVVQAIAYFVARCVEPRAPPLGPGPAFNRGTACPRVSEIYTSVRIEQVAGTLGDKAAGTANLDKRSNQRRLRPIPNADRDALSLDLTGDVAVQTNFYALNTNQKFPAWNFVDLVEVHVLIREESDPPDFELVNRLVTCPPASYFVGFDQKGQMICECLARPNTNALRRGPPDRITCSTSCSDSDKGNDINNLLIGVTETGLPICVNRSYHIVNPSQPRPEDVNSVCHNRPVALAGNVSSCIEEQQSFERLTGLDSQECYLEGDDVVCNVVNVQCCGYYVQ